MVQKEQKQGTNGMLHIETLAMYDPCTGKGIVQNVKTIQ